MEQLQVSFDSAGFDRLVHSGAQQASEITIAVKDQATEGGLPGAVIAFQAMINGSVYQVQAVTTVRLLIRNLELLKTKYPDL